MYANTRRGAALVCLMLLGSFQLSNADGGGDANNGPGDVTPGPTNGSPDSTATLIDTTPKPATPSPTNATAAPTTTTTTTTDAHITSTDPRTTIQPSFTPSPATTIASPTSTPSPVTASLTTSAEAAAVSTAAVTTPTPAPTTQSPISLQPTPTQTTAASATNPAGATGTTLMLSPSTPVVTNTVTPATTSMSPPGSGSTAAPVSNFPVSVQSTSVVPGATGSIVVSSPSTVAPESGITTAAPAATATTTTSAPKPTTAAPTPASVYPIKKPEKPFRLDLKIGTTSDSTVYCTNSSKCAFVDIADDLSKAFSSVPGYLYVRNADNTNRRKRATPTQTLVQVLFDPAVVTALSEVERSTIIVEALRTLSNSPDVHVDMSSANNTIVDLFVEADVCKIPGTCPMGYVCEHALCHHLCEKYNCGEHGECNAVVNADGTAVATCLCGSDSDHTYTGNKCQNMETSKAKVAAILGGVLGGLSAVLLLIVIFLCCHMRRNKDGGSTGKYQLRGHSNNGYADQEIPMKDRP